MRGIILACCCALAAAAAERPRDKIAVLELKSKLTGAARADIDAAYLTERVRAATHEAMPQAFLITRENMIKLVKGGGKSLEECEGQCEWETGQLLGADLVVSGELLKYAGSYKITLKLTATADGEMISSVLAQGENAEALEQDLLRATQKLFAPLLKKTGGGAELLQIGQGGAKLPDVPAAPGSLAEGGVGLDVNPDALVARDGALDADKSAKERPEEAANAWQKLADVGGNNPFKAEASARSKEWRAFAEKKKAYEAQVASDTANLRKVLPLRSVAPAMKTQLLLRYEKLYGESATRSLLNLVEPRDVRDDAERALRCEAKDAGSCLAVAHRALQDEDASGAMDYLDRACTAGSIDGCEELGMRAADASAEADKLRGASALQKACEAGRGRSCSKLAALEQSRRGGADSSKLAQLTQKACDGGDAQSCLRLSRDEKNPARVASLRSRACSLGDQQTCGEIRAAEQREADARAEAARKAAAAQTAREQAEAEAKERASRRGTGWLLDGAGAVTTIGFGYFLFAGMKQNDNVKAGGFATKAELQSAVDKGHTYNLLAIGCGAASVALVGIGTAMVMLNRDGDASPPPQSKPWGVGVAPGGIVVAGRFP